MVATDKRRAVQYMINKNTFNKLDGAFDMGGELSYPVMAVRVCQVLLGLRAVQEGSKDVYCGRPDRTG